LRAIGCHPSDRAHAALDVRKVVTTHSEAVVRVVPTPTLTWPVRVDDPRVRDRMIGSGVTGPNL
jgi:hypothetical protein